MFNIQVTFDQNVTISSDGGLCINDTTLIATPVYHHTKDVQPPNGGIL